jgi:hypothetical protein
VNAEEVIAELHACMQCDAPSLASDSGVFAEEPLEAALEGGSTGRLPFLEEPFTSAEWASKSPDTMWSTSL